MEQVYQYIDNNRDRFVQELLEFVAQPSISATGEGIEACANWLVQAMEKIGISAELFSSSGAPMVYGEIVVSSAKKNPFTF